MNKNRRDALSKIFFRLDAMQKELAALTLPFHTELIELRDELDTLKSEEQDFFDEKSEKWQEGDKGTHVAELIQAMQDAYDEMDESASNLEDFTEDDFFKHVLECLDNASAQPED